MSRKITATEAARNLSDLLNRVRYGRETFVIVRGGEEVGQLAPAERSRPTTLRALIEVLEGLERPDSRFAEDLEEIQAKQPVMSEDPWRS